MEMVDLYVKRNYIWLQNHQSIDRESIERKYYEAGKDCLGVVYALKNLLPFLM